MTRGDGDDVLGRTWQAAQEFDLDLVLRATGDNPGVDIQTPGRVVAALRATGADYVVEEGLPYGAAVEGMTARAYRAHGWLKPLRERCARPCPSPWAGWPMASSS